MEFTLFYRGELKSKGSPTDKQKIRRAFHPQLKKLWELEPLNDHKSYIEPSSENDICILEQIGDFTFAPLISSRLSLVAELDITLLRPEEPGTILIQCGDIDNRLKTLFDALSVPAHENQLPSSDSQKSDEIPLFCLLQDDRLITKVTVRTDRLLLNDCTTDKEVVILIQTRTKVTKHIWGNMHFT